MVDVHKRTSLLDEEEAQADANRFRPLAKGAAVAALLSVLLVPALYRPTVAGKLPFDSSLRTQLSLLQPKYVFIGNSMLGTRIDAATLAAHLGNGCCYVLWTGGAESAWTHQALKNEVLPAVRPKIVFIFFRDAYLTRTTFRTNDQYWWKIERVSHQSEPALMRAMDASRTWQERLEYALGRVYPLQKRREALHYALEWLASQLVRPGHPAYGEPIGEGYNTLFSLDRLRHSEAADDASAASDDSNIYDFNARLPASLLPSMIGLARDAGVKLVFVRVQRRPTKNGPPPQSAALRAYIGKLKEYLAQQGAGFYDFTGDVQLPLSHYLDGDHIAPQWKVASTELFLHRLEEYFR